MTEKDKIIAILYEAIRVARDYRFRGIRLSTRIANMKLQEIPEQLRLKIDEKAELFYSGMPEDCLSYKYILDKARKCLQPLKERDYTFEAQELINNFLAIETVFKNDLTFVGIREHEMLPKDKKLEPEPVYRKTEPGEPIRYLQFGVRQVDIKSKEAADRELAEKIEDLDINQL